jgi:hypothetical protein
MKLGLVMTRPRIAAVIRSVAITKTHVSTVFTLRARNAVTPAVAPDASALEVHPEGSDPGAPVRENCRISPGSTAPASATHLVAEDA